MEQRKKEQYKISYKKLGFRVGGMILVIGLVWGGIGFFKKRAEIQGETKVYEVLIQLQDQVNPDPEEDAKSSAKKGDAILVRETGKVWSKTERISYLILKIKLNEDQAQKIVQAKTRKLSKKEGLEKGLIDNDKLEKFNNQTPKQELTEDILFREYRVKIEELDFDWMKVRERQPFEKEVFEWEMIQKKETVSGI